MRLFKYLLPIVVAMGFATSLPLIAHGEHGGEGHHEGHHHDEHQHGENHHGDHHHDDHHHDDHHHGNFAYGGQDRSQYLQEINEKDWEALRDFLASKREAAAEKGKGDGDDDDDDCGLTISGDVRFEWRHLNEKGFNFDGEYTLLRGGHAIKGDKPVSRNDFDIEFNLRFDYVCDRAWAVAHLDFDNSAGVSGNDHACACDPAGYHGSGNCDSICLKKAYFGYNIYTCHDKRLDIEIGRRNLYNVFDSQIEFLSRFDGITLKYSDRIGDFSDWYWNTAGFVVDERVNQFAWVTEVGLLDIADSGFDLKYSFIDWRKNGRNRCFARNPRGFNYMVSQITSAYHVDKKVFGAPLKIYGAVLKNHSNVRIRLPNYEKIKNDIAEGNDDFDRKCIGPDNYLPSIKGQPWGWYLGFVYGEVIKEGDYAFSAQYEYVQATAMPDEDAAGIGVGNVLNQSFTENGRGNTNYKGFKFEFLYALTDNLSLDSILEVSQQIKKSIGGRHHYSKIELEAIYAF